MPSAFTWTGCDQGQDPTANSMRNFHRSALDNASRPATRLLPALTGASRAVPCASGACLRALRAPCADAALPTRMTCAPRRRPTGPPPYAPVHVIGTSERDCDQCSHGGCPCRVGSAGLRPETPTASRRSPASFRRPQTGSRTLRVDAWTSSVEQAAEGEGGAQHRARPCASKWPPPAFTAAFSVWLWNSATPYGGAGTP